MCEEEGGGCEAVKGYEVENVKGVGLEVAASMACCRWWRSPGFGGGVSGESVDVLHS